MRHSSRVGPHAVREHEPRGRASPEGDGILSGAALVAAIAIHARPLPRAWVRGAVCVHSHESGDWHIVNAPYMGGFQFLLSTWNSVRGHHAGSLAQAATASPLEQLRSARAVWVRDGGSWREWPTTSRECGLR